MRNTSILLATASIYAETEETIQRIILVSEAPVISLPYGQRQGTVRYRLVYDIHKEPHLLITHHDTLETEDGLGAFYSLETLVREIKEDRYLTVDKENYSPGFRFAPQKHNKTKFHRMEQVIRLMDYTAHQP